MLARYVLIAALVAWPASADPAKTLTVAADVWCPINCAPGDPLPGIGIELARQVFEPLGYQVEYKVMPWARALEEVRAGRIDAAVGANREDDATLLFPQHPIYDITDDFYARAKNPPPFKDISSLKGLRLGIIKDYGYDESIQRFVEANRKLPGAVQEVGGDDALEQNIKKLMAGRIDVVVESRAVMDYTLHRLQLERDIVWLGGIRQGYIYLAFSPALPASKERVRQFDEGIAALKAAGKLEALYAPYGMRTEGHLP